MIELWICMYMYQMIKTGHFVGMKEKQIEDEFFNRVRHCLFFLHILDIRIVLVFLISIYN